MDETKNLSIEDLHYKLVESLHQLAKHYSSLFDIIKREKDILIQADIERLHESNKTKEALIFHIRQLDLHRQKLAAEYGTKLGLSIEGIRLQDLAGKVSRDRARELKDLQVQLELIIERVIEINKDNEQYAKSALKLINGAMGEIRDTLGGSKTYQRKGKMSEGPERSGNLVSKEA